MRKNRLALVTALAGVVATQTTLCPATAQTLGEVFSTYDTPDKLIAILQSQPSASNLDALLTPYPTSEEVLALAEAHPVVTESLNLLLENYPSDSTVDAITQSYRTQATADVVTAANAFLATLDSTELAETVYPYTLANVEVWSNLPGVSRNGPTLEADSTATTTSTSTGGGGGGTTGGDGPPTGSPPGGGGGTGGGGGGGTTTTSTFALTDAQNTAALALIKAAVSTPGFAFFNNIRTADDLLGAEQTGYGSANYHIAMIGTPSTTSPWMLQIGGHHLAYNITFNGAAVSATPMFMGVEPPNFSVLANGSLVASGLVDGSTEYFVNGTETSTAPDSTGATQYAPLETQRAATETLLTAIQADSNVSSAAMISGSFDDVTMSVASSTSHDTDYPFNSATETEKLYPTGTTNRGVLFTQLSPIEQIDALLAIGAWVSNARIDTAVDLYLKYVNPTALAQTYVGYAPGEGGTADFSAFPNSQAQANEMQGSYLRIDGPELWIEAIVQSAVVFSQQGWVHYHTLWRDKSADYGGCFVTGAQTSTC